MSEPTEFPGDEQLTLDPGVLAEIDEIAPPERDSEEPATTAGAPTEDEVPDFLGAARDEQDADLPTIEDAPGLLDSPDAEEMDPHAPADGVDEPSAVDAGGEAGVFVAEADDVKTGELETAELETAELETAELAADQRVADEPAADDENADDDEDAAPVVPAAFGLIFQPPQPPPARRATRPAGAATPRPATFEPEPTPERDFADEPTTAASFADRGGDDATSATQDTEVAADSAAEENAEPTGRSRRRRGGRGRKSRETEPEAQESDEASTPHTDSAPDGEGQDEASQDDAESDDDQASDNDAEATEGGGRRRRRRRRASSAAEGEDPPGTVTKVRESRRARDEVTSVRGSTRLEAKKQRRREGREAGRRRTIITEKEFLARRESVERTMVVRRRAGRTQIAVLEDGILVEHYVSRTTNASMAGNIYLGRVQNVLPSMEAAFVDIGRGRNAVLYAGEVNWDVAGLETGSAKRIENALSSGETVLVQVTKDPLGHKGARLTSQISLPGRYLVYVPQGNMTGISRKLPDTERARLKSILKEIVPADAGVIVRTAAEGASEEELRRDVERLAKTWERVSAAADKKGGKKNAPSLLYSEPDLTVRVIRDVFNEDFSSLVIAGDEVWEEISTYIEDVAPDLAARMTKWTSERDVFAEHRIDEQIAKALDRKVYLPSGGSLVIDRTEAMTVVDVNTGKFVGSGGNLEETVTKNNLEAAEEIVRQLRLRDIGGIIVVDFIDMVLESNRDLVVRRLLECLGRDRTKHQVAEVTSLGLVQMTRKRVASGLLEVFSEPCECCNGRGVVVRDQPVEESQGGNGHSGNGSGKPGNGHHDNGHGGNGHGGNGSGGNGSNHNGHDRGGNDRGGNDRGGNDRGGNDRNGNDRGGRRRGGRDTSEESAPTPVRTGPTAAQIAAAAHAAALKATAGEPAQLSAEDAELPEVSTRHTDSDVDTLAGLNSSTSGLATSDLATADLVTSDLAAADVAAASDLVSGADLPGTSDPDARTTPVTVEPETSAATGRPRRRRGRATAPAGPPPSTPPAE